MAANLFQVMAMSDAPWAGEILKRCSQCLHPPNRGVGWTYIVVAYCCQTIYVGPTPQLQNNKSSSGFKVQGDATNCLCGSLRDHLDLRRKKIPPSRRCVVFPESLCFFHTLLPHLRGRRSLNKTMGCPISKTKRLHSALHTCDVFTR